MMLGGREPTVRVLAERADGAFDPAVVRAVTDDVELGSGGDESVWRQVLAQIRCGRALHLAALQAHAALDHSEHLRRSR